MPYPTRRARRVLSTTACGALLLVATAATAGEAPPAERHGGLAEIDRLIQRELDRVLDRMMDALGTLPRYALPEMTEDGDIIIRRLPPRPEGWTSPDKDTPDIVEL